MKKIRLMADYFCFPLWHNSGVEFGDIDPEQLPLSPELKQSLLEWAAEFDAILCMDDPASSDFPSRRANIEFVAKGDVLLDRLKEELGPEYSVVYFREYS